MAYGNRAVALEALACSEVFFFLFKLLQVLPNLLSLSRSKLLELYWDGSRFAY